VKHSAQQVARRAVLLAALAAAAAGSSACGALGVKPWERDLMARPEMSLDAYPVESGIDEHIYFSKEAATGGGGFGGGGCGCN
jgi:streptogramin lyase